MLVMYDSITVEAIPKSATAVAGYVGGFWPTYKQLQREFGHVRLLSIAVNSSEDADCLDVEKGDARPQDAPAWVKRQQARGIKRPVIYCSVSVVPAVVAALRADGLSSSSVRWWTAHYVGRPHLCGPGCGMLPNHIADATQWTDRALGRNLDESLCGETFLPPLPPIKRPRRIVPHPIRKPTPVHPKVKGATVGAALATGVTAALHALGIAFTPAEASAIAASLSFIGGYLVPSPPRG